MSNKNQETIADIADAMRNEGHTGEASCLEWIRTKMTYYADRIEAALKRGNDAKMREALQRIANMGEQIDYRLGSSEETVYALRDERCLAHNISECARAALTEPPRNCDRPECATTDAAQEVWCKEDGGKTAYYEWLLATYKKGETDGSK